MARPPFVLDEIQHMVEVLGHSESVRAAAAELGTTPDVLKHAFHRRGMPTPATYLPPRQRPQWPQPRDRSGQSRVVEAEPERRAPPPRPSVRAPSPSTVVGEQTDVDRLVVACRKGAKTEAALLDALDCGPSRLRAAIAEAQARGYTIATAGDTVAMREPAAGEDPDRVQDVGVAQTSGGRSMLGVMSDTHFGSKYCMRSEIKDWAQHAYARGVRLIAHAGDMLDGCYDHGRWELSHHGWDEQAGDAIETLPRLAGLEYWFVDGNHDETFWRSTGMLSGRRLEDAARAAGRQDLRYLGPRYGRLALRTPGHARPVVVELWHPKPGKAYALSYHVQKRIESYGPGTKPDLLVCGHWHTAVSLEVRGVHALAGACFQSPESSFARSLVGGVSCGAHIVSWERTDRGTLRHVAVERSAYYLRESARDVELEAAS